MMKTRAPSGGSCGCKTLKENGRQRAEVPQIRKMTRCGQEGSCRCCTCSGDSGRHKRAAGRTYIPRAAEWSLQKSDVVRKPYARCGGMGCDGCCGLQEMQGRGREALPRDGAGAAGAMQQHWPSRNQLWRIKQRGCKLPVANVTNTLLEIERPRKQQRIGQSDAQNEAPTESPSHCTAWQQHPLPHDRAACPSAAPFLNSSSGKR